MNDFFKNFLIIIFVIYSVGVGIFTIYFNYQYAVSHTFWEWFFFGQIMPTIQAIFFPFYFF